MKIATHKAKWLNSLQVCWQLISRISQWLQFRNPVFILMLTRGIAFFSSGHSQIPTMAFNNGTALNQSLQLHAVIIPPTALADKACLATHTQDLRRETPYPSGDAHLWWCEHP